MKNNPRENVPSIGLYTYEEEDIIKFQNPIPKLKPMKGTMKLHEIEHILQQQEVTLMIKDKSTNATAQKVSLELQGCKLVERDEDSDYSDSLEEEAPEINGKPDDSILFIAEGVGIVWGVGKKLKI